MNKIIRSLVVAFVLWCGTALVGGFIVLLCIFAVGDVTGVLYDELHQPKVISFIWGIYFAAQFLVPTVYLYKKYRTK